MRHVVLKKKDYEVYFDYVLNEVDNTEFIHGHMEVFKYSKTVKRQLVKDIIALARLQELPIYVSWDIKDLKFLKFITMIGFVPAPITDNENDVFFIWKDVK
jgi:hypothetical protein